MATDAELLDLANQAQGLPPEPPPPLARQVPPGTPGAVEGPVYKDPAAAPLIDPAIAAQTPGLAEPPAPVAPVTAVPPPAPAPAPVAAGKPSIQNAANAADIATQAGFDTATAQGEVAKAKAGEREGNAAAQDKVAALERAHADEIAQQQATQKAAFDQANAVASKAEDEYGKSANGLHDLMQNKADAQLAKARIFIAVGAAANALVGGGNPALEKLKLTIDNDFRIQESKLRSQEHFASMKRAGVASVSSQFAHDTALLGLKQAAAYQAAATEAKAEAIRRGASPEEAENNVAVLALKQKALELNATHREKLQQDLASQMMAGAHLALARATADAARPENKPLNESQGKANAFAAQMDESRKVFDKLPEISDKGKETIRDYASQQVAAEASPNWNAALTSIGIRKPIEKLLSPEDARVYSAQQRFLTPLLRDESGAAIGASEFTRRYGDLMDMPGDSPETRADKKRQREIVIQGAKDKAGPAAPVNKAPRTNSTPASNGAAPAKGRRVTYKGQPGTLVGNEFTPDAP